jgi:cellulose biosynthesis protein BcsQ
MLSPSYIQGVAMKTIAVALAGEPAQEAGSPLLIDLTLKATHRVGCTLKSIRKPRTFSSTYTMEKRHRKNRLPSLSILPTKGLGGIVRSVAALGYAYSILDLSPYFGTLEKTALLTSDEAITPATADGFGPTACLSLPRASNGCVKTMKCPALSTSG